MSALERKKPAVDLKRSYVINIQVGLIGVLIFFITIFKLNLDFGSDFEIIDREQEVIEMEEVIQTEQETTPPPPPRPPQPEPVPDDEIIEDQFFDLDADMDLDAPMDMPPPPPPDEEDEEPEIFQVVEDMPEPVGGMQAIYENLTYPDAARRSGIEGRVIIQFIVDENGDVQNPQVVRGIGGGCDEAAIQAIESVEWTVGRQRGRPVRVQFQLPIMFRLQDS